MIGPKTKELIDEGTLSLFMFKLRNGTKIILRDGQPKVVQARLQYMVEVMRLSGEIDANTYTFDGETLEKALAAVEAGIESVK